MATEPPGTPRVAGQDGRRVDLAWEPGPWDGATPDEYALRHRGTREHYGPDAGERDGIDTARHAFSGRGGFRYRFAARARFGDDWTDWSPWSQAADMPLTFDIDAGRLTALRVHREIGHGPPHDHLRAHAIASLDDVPHMAFGFPIPFHLAADRAPAPPVDIAADDTAGAAPAAAGAGRVDRLWLDVLRDAIARNRGVIISSESAGGNRLIRDVATIPAPARPTELWVGAPEGRLLRLQWRHENTGHRGEGLTYELRYEGTRPLRRKDTGRHTGLTLPEFEFTGKGGYRYTFAVRARNVSGIGGWSEEVRAERLPTEPVQETKKVQGRLEPDIPHEGPILYLARFAPSGRDPEVLSIRVLGSDLDRWGAHFLPPGSGRADCANQDRGAIVWPGEALEGAGMRAVYGAERPAPPLALIACKVVRRPPYDRVEAIPVEITYRRWVD